MTVFKNFIIIMILSMSSSIAYSFTYNNHWSIPDNQKCDHWNTVAFYVPTVLPVIRPGQSRKITIEVPINSETVNIQFKGHASQPSYLITVINHNEPFHINPKLGANVSWATTHLKDYVYIYQNHINNRINLGDSTMHHVAATFKLTQAECDKRNGHPAPVRVVVPDLEVKPIILRSDFSFNLNQLTINDIVYAVQFVYSHESNGEFYFKTKTIRPVTVDDYDKDSYTILNGDCNDDNPGINPNEGNCISHPNINLP